MGDKHKNICLIAFFFLRYCHKHVPDTVFLKIDLELMSFTPSYHQVTSHLTA